MKTYPAAFFLALMLGLLIFSAAGAVKGPGCGGVPAELSQKKAPDFTLPQLDEFKAPVSLAKIYAEQPVLLVFWATWCPSCAAEIPELEKIHRKFEPLGLKVLAVNIQEPAEKVAAYRQKKHFTYTCLLDREGKAAERYAVDALPTAVLLAKGGQIIYYGFHLPQGLEAMIQAVPRAH